MHPNFIKFWGVRDRSSLTGKEYARYGREGICVEVRCGTTQLIFGTGSGIRTLLRDDKNEALNTHLFISSLDLDLLDGLIHFVTCQAEDTDIGVWVAVPEKKYLEANADGTETSGSVKWNAVTHKVNFEPRPSMSISTIFAHGVNGFRVEYGGQIICHLSISYPIVTIMPAIIEAAKGADILIYNQAPDLIHTSWEKAVSLRDAAEVKLLALTRHGQECTDTVLDNLSYEAAITARNVVFARQDMTIAL